MLRGANLLKIEDGDDCDFSVPHYGLIDVSAIGFSNGCGGDAKEDCTAHWSGSPEELLPI